MLTCTYKIAPNEDQNNNFQRIGVIQLKSAKGKMPLKNHRK